MKRKLTLIGEFISRSNCYTLHRCSASDLPTKSQFDVYCRAEPTSIGPTHLSDSSMWRIQMCDTTRRKMLAGGAALLGLSMTEAKAIVSAKPEIGKVDPIGTDVYFHEGNLALGHCNNG